jgi:hypothetical protein
LFVVLLISAPLSQKLEPPANPVRFKNAGGFSPIWDPSALTADRNIALPNAAGTMALTSDSDTKAWVSFNGTGTVAINSSRNVSSITDGGVGIFTVNFTTAMADANYAVLFGGNVGGSIRTDPADKTTTGVKVSTYSAAPALADYTHVCVAVMR